MKLAEKWSQMVIKIKIRNSIIYHVPNYKIENAISIEKIIKKGFKSELLKTFEPIWYITKVSMDFVRSYFGKNEPLTS